MPADSGLQNGHKSVINHKQKGKYMRKKTKRTQYKPFDLSSWNFVIFLTLTLILIVTILTAMKQTALDVRIRAGLACPDVSKSLPRPEDCPGGKWAYSRDFRGCPMFVCEQ
jgi:hypothetical protein